MKQILPPLQAVWKQPPPPASWTRRSGTPPPRTPCCAASAREPRGEESWGATQVDLVLSDDDPYKPLNLINHEMTLITME